VETLIAQITGLLGIDAGTAQFVLAGLLDIARQSLGPDAGAALLAQIPGADEVLATSLLGSGGISLSALLGGGPGPEALAELVRDSGLSPHEVATIADLLLDYAQEHAGHDAAMHLYQAIPGLAGLG
jgi:hypothetical protein